MTARLLTPADGEALRELRLTALSAEGRFFTADPIKEASMTLLQWGAAAEETTEHAMFGAFDKSNLIGMAGVKKMCDATAYWGSDYTLPDKRGSFAAARLYALRVKWCLDHGLTEARFTIHHENTAVINLHEKRGAVHIGAEPMRFADGKTAMAHWYRIGLG